MAESFDFVKVVDADAMLAYALSFLLLELVLSEVGFGWLAKFLLRAGFCLSVGWLADHYLLAILWYIFRDESLSDNFAIELICLICRLL